MSAPRILHVFPSFVAAGAQVRTVQVIAGLGRRYEHEVLALDGRLDALSLPGAGDLKPAELGGEPLPHGIGAARSALARLAPDLLVTYNWGSFDFVLGARPFPHLLGRTRVPHLHVEDGFNADEAERQKPRRVWSRRLALRSAARVIVVSRNLERIALDSWRLPSARVQRIPNGVDPERFEPTEPLRSAASGHRERLGIGAQDLVIGAVGHLRPVKRFDRLIEAASALSPVPGRRVHLVVIGDGPERAALEALAREHAPPGGGVHFPGHQHELAPWYHALDVLAISSDSEQLPVSLLEAMASGLPVVSTDVGDVRHVLPPLGQRYVVPLGPDAAASLAAVTGSMLEDQDLRSELARAGRTRLAENFSEAAMLQSWDRAFQEALSVG